MPLLMSLTAGAPERDPRAQRAVATARLAGLDVVEIGRPGTDARPARATSRYPRELRGIVRLLRLARTTVQLARRARAATPRPDIVHAHDPDTLPAGWLAARRAGP